MEYSKIEWTHHTFNPWEGCTKVSEGCQHCYAETRNMRWNKGQNWGKGAPRRRTSQDIWKLPAKWNTGGNGFHAWRKITDFTGIGKGWTHQCILCGSVTDQKGAMGQPGWCANKVRLRVFCASLSDWLDDEVPIEWLADLLGVIAHCTNLDWLLLTKRPENWERRLRLAAVHLQSKSGYLNYPAWKLIDQWLPWNGVQRDAPPQHIWVGTTTENQRQAEIRIPDLLKIPAKVRFLSVEPMLGPILLSHVRPVNPNAPCVTDFLSGITYWPDNDQDEGSGVDWVICGGESGPGKRAFDPNWARSLRDQCVAEDVPFFMKQWDKVKAIPADLMVRQFPKRS